MLLLLFNQRSTGGATGTAFQSFVEAGMFLGIWQIDDYLTFTACIHDATGAAADADAVPSYAIYENETATAIVTGNMAQLGAVTGFYTERVQLTATNGFEIGKCYAIRIAATVGAIPAAAAHVFQMGAQINSVSGSIGGDVAGKVLGGGAGTITGVGTSANVTLWNGDALQPSDIGGTPTVTIYGNMQTLDALWSKIQKWLRLGFRKDLFVTTDHATELGEINANTGTGAGAFANTIDSLEALAASSGGGLNAAQTGDAVLDEVIEGSYTLRQMMRLISAALAGVSSGGGTTAVTFTGLDGSTPRIVATVDANGNRTAVTKTVT